MSSLFAARARRWLGVGLAFSLLVVPGTASADPPTEPSFTFTGGGYGHGTGMSQYGAQGQALAGRSWQQILSTYFTGVGFAYLLRRTGCRLRSAMRARSGSASNRTSPPRTSRSGRSQRRPALLSRVTRGDEPGRCVRRRRRHHVVRLRRRGLHLQRDRASSWPAGPCNFDLEWDGWSESPTVALDTTLVDDEPSCDQSGERCYSRGTLLIRPNAASRRHRHRLPPRRPARHGALPVRPARGSLQLGGGGPEGPGGGRPLVCRQQAGPAGSPESSRRSARSCAGASCTTRPSISSTPGGAAGAADWIDAVDATAGLVLYHADGRRTLDSIPRAGSPIAVPTYYSSSTFGHTEDSAVAFGSGFTPSYLVGVDDPWSVIPEAGNPLGDLGKDVHPHAS